MNFELKNNWDFFRWMLAALLAAMLWIFITSSKPNNSDYCDCFPAGWERGWCNEEVGCKAPPHPPCPRPNPNETDDCEGGYLRGYEMAIEDKNG